MDKKHKFLFFFKRASLTVLFLLCQVSQFQRIEGALYEQTPTVAKTVAGFIIANKLSVGGGLAFFGLWMIWFFKKICDLTYAVGSNYFLFYTLFELNKTTLSDERKIAFFKKAMEYNRVKNGLHIARSLASSTPGNRLQALVEFDFAIANDELKKVKKIINDWSSSDLGGPIKFGGYTTDPVLYRLLDSLPTKYPDDTKAFDLALERASLIGSVLESEKFDLQGLESTPLRKVIDRLLSRKNWFLLTEQNYLCKILKKSDNATLLKALNYQENNRNILLKYAEFGSFELEYIKLLLDNGSTIIPTKVESDYLLGLYMLATEHTLHTVLENFVNNAYLDTLEQTQKDEEIKKRKESIKQVFNCKVIEAETFLDKIRFAYTDTMNAQNLAIIENFSK